MTYRTLGTATHHGMTAADLEFLVPLDHAEPGGEKLSVFARSIVDADKPDAGHPWLVFLQGGPGSAGPRPSSRSGWLKRALQEYRVLLLDSRGNGRSSVVLPQTLARRGDARAQAAYLSHFRADAIVKDCEVIRRELAGPDHKWSVLGQSYGGFCAVQYLSAHPEGLREAFIAGGLPPLTASADDYYRATYPVVRSKTRKFFARYPRDEALAAQIMEHLHARDVRLPTGGRLTVRRFQQSGFLLGFDLGTTGTLIIIIIIYLLLGTFMEDISMLILTLPVVMPVLKALGVDMIWFGVVAVLIIQMGILSPPVGLNVFIVKGIVPDVPMYTIFRGIWPFWYAMGLLIALLLTFPQLALFLPNTMFR